MYTSLYEEEVDPDAIPELTQNIIDSNNKFHITYINKNMDYTETGGAFDTENNHTIPGYGYTVSVMNDLLLGNDYVRFQYQNNQGYTNYIGSVRQRDPAQITENNVRYGKGYVWNENTMLVPYAQFGWYEWKRAINNGKIYDHNYIGVGVVADYSVTPALVLKIDDFIGWTRGANINIEAGTVFSAALGSSPIYKIGAAADYAITKKIHANIGYEYTNFKYGESAAFPVTVHGDQNEPASTTKLRAFTLGLSYSF